MQLAPDCRWLHAVADAMSKRLASERSAYLRQHADNPVEWWPWGDEAIKEARASRRPILLSIGYSACHWCHVMAHESFEDEATAAVMNRLFVNIKVDREDRPDLDRIYQLAHQALTGRGGGWPLTVFLDADDLLPFLAGTYFPPEPRHGLPSFVEVLQRARQWHDDNPGARKAQSRQLQDWLKAQRRAASTVPVSVRALRQAFATIQAQFDSKHGGHRGAPKFPHVSELHLLLDARDTVLADHAHDVDTMVMRSLDGMAEGGLQDHLGGGFFRYSVDAEWEIPHFEKMLYDNAQLLEVYARAAQTWDNAGYARAASRTAAWLARDMQLPRGGFAASLDADSEGGEGAWYVWQDSQLEPLLSAEQWAVIRTHHGFDKAPNFEQRAWHLTARTPLDAIARALSLPVDTVRQRRDSAQQKMLKARLLRPPPARDGKLLCAWNAMTIAALARSARHLHDGGMLALAESALRALRESLWQEGKLQRSTSSDTAGFLDDHAFLLDALLALLNCRWRREDLDWAIRLADILLNDFMDRKEGAFEYSAHDETVPLAGPKDFFDESLPSANGVAIDALFRLGHWLGKTRYINAAEAGLKAASALLDRHPQACATVLRALQRQLDPPAHVLVRVEASSIPAWRKVLDEHPRLDAWTVPADAEPLPGILASQSLAEGARGRAWLCRGTHCQAPLTTPEELAAALL